MSAWGRSSACGAAGVSTRKQKQGHCHLGYSSMGLCHRQVGARIRGKQHKVQGTAGGAEAHGCMPAVLGGDQWLCWGRSSTRLRQKGRSGVFFVRPVVCLTSHVSFPCRTHRHAAGVARQNTGSGEQSPSARSRHRQQAKSTQHAGMANGTANGTGEPALVGGGGDRARGCVLWEKMNFC